MTAKRIVAAAALLAIGLFAAAASAQTTLRIGLAEHRGDSVGGVFERHPMLKALLVEQSRDDWRARRRRVAGEERLPSAGRARRHRVGVRRVREDACDQVCGHIWKIDGERQRDRTTASGVHPIFLVEDEYRLAMVAAEAEFIRQFIENVTRSETGWAEPWAAFHSNQASGGEEK